MTKTIRNAMLVAVLSVLIFQFAIGYADASWEDDLAHLKGSEITVLVRSGSFYVPGTSAVAEEFSKRTGIKVTINEVGRAGYFASLTTQLGSRSPDTDVAWFLSIDLPRYVDGGALEKLDTYVDTNLTAPGLDIQDLLGLVTVKDELYQIPVDISTHYTYYRTDLIDSPPETWDEYFAVAKKFTKAHNPDSPTQYGAVWTAQPPELARLFASVLFTHDGDLWDPSKGVLVNQPPVIEAVTRYIDFLEAGVAPIDLLSWNFNAVKDGLETGRIAMAAPHWNSAIGQIQRGNSEFADKIAVAPMPGIRRPDGSVHRLAYQQSWGLVINSGSKNKEAAWAFVSFLASEEGQKIIIDKVGGLTPTLKSLLLDPAYEGRPDTKHWRLQYETLQNAKSWPSEVWLPDAEQRFSDALIEAISGARSIEEALDNAARDIEKMIE